MPETLNFMQWKFTACRYNMENANGFNTFSMSGGLTREDKEDLIRSAGSYTPPDNLPDEPTDDEIREMFPVKFSSFTLRSGKRAVVRTVYVGKDYAGVRWGNFFSHGLILSGGDWPFYPIQLWESRLFRDGLDEDELALQSAPPPLPEMTVSESDFHDFSAEIPVFIAEDPTRGEALVSLLTAARNARASGKPVLLRDDPANAPLWMAAIQYAFPRSAAGKLAFTTYAHSPANAQNFPLVFVPPEGTAFPFGSPSLDGTYRVFDFHQGRLPAFSPKTLIYTDLVRTDEWTYPGNDMRELHDFIDANRLECDPAGDSPEKGVLLYRFLKQDWQPAEKDFPAMLAYLAGHPLRARGPLTVQLLAKRRICSLKILEMLLPDVLKTLVESRFHPRLMEPFRDFLAAQFARKPAELDRDECQARFAFLDRFFATLPSELRDGLPDHARGLLAGGQAGDYAFYFYALILLQLSDDPARFEQELSHFPQLSGKDFHVFHEATLALAVSRACLPEIHHLLVEFFYEHDGEFSEYHAKRYLGVLSERLPGEQRMRYGTDRWKHGKEAEPQATAFMKYVLNTPTEQWKLWRGNGSGYYDPGPVFFFWKQSMKSEEVFRWNQFWNLFDVGKDLRELNLSFQKRKKRWQYIHNLRKVLRPLCPMPASLQRTKLRNLGLPSRWDIWRNTVMRSGMVLATAVGIVAAVCLGSMYGGMLLEKLWDSLVWIVAGISVILAVLAGVCLFRRGKKKKTRGSTPLEPVPEEPGIFIPPGTPPPDGLFVAADESPDLSDETLSPYPEENHAEKNAPSTPDSTTEAP